MSKHYTRGSRLEAAQDAGYDYGDEPAPLTAEQRADFRANDPWGRALTASVEQVRDLQAGPDPEVERLLQQELAERDREWWSE